MPLGRRYVLSLLCTEVALIVSHPHGVNARKNICFLMLEKNTGSLLSVCIAGGAPALGNSFWCGFWRIETVICAIQNVGNFVQQE